GAWEEIDRQRAGAPGGANYGWNVMEGTHCYPPGSDCDPAPFARPVAEYDHEGNCSVTGGYVARGGSPALRGVYVFGDYCSGRIWGLDSAGPDRQEPTLLLESGRSITSFGEDEAGVLYLTDVARGDLVRVSATR
ncbi:MAG TPA: hypothetical protein VIV06_04895, partial [Candidatus Limnocylindrales bacterium]